MSEAVISPKVEPRLAPLRTRSGELYEAPLFLPVYQPRHRVFQLAAWTGEPKIEGIIVNSYFLYKQRELRTALTADASLKRFVNFAGLVATDSGAFQALTRQLFLNNKDIIRFQDAIGADIISPLDLITPPGDTRTIALDKLRATEKRIEEGLRLVERGVLAGVQQGGRFLDLRHESICRLVEMGVQYVAIGSLVPFFNVKHHLGFPAAVIADARREVGTSIPIHVYGAGDPCELPFMVACGATIFDSASYGRYAEGGSYMTPYGALSDAGPIVAGEFRCPCPICVEHPIDAVFADKTLLTHHNLWTICNTIALLRGIGRDSGALEKRLIEILAIHQSWFPDSLLGSSWESFVG